MKFIYIVLSATETVPARIIRFYTRANYSHASVSLHENLSEMCSFARKRVSNFLNSGFVEESPRTLTRGKDVPVMVKIFKVPVSDEGYEKADRFINGIRGDPEGYIYNILSFITATFGYYSNVYKTYICTNFVVDVLEKAGVLPEGQMKRNVAYIPADIDEMLSAYEFFSGDIRDYRPSHNIVCSDDLFFSHIGVIGETKETFRNFKRFAQRYMKRGLKNESKG